MPLWPVLRAAALLFTLFMPLAAVHPAAAQSQEQADVQAAIDQLIIVLRDPVAREALIGELQAATPAPDEAPAPGEELAIGDELRSLGSQIAEISGDVVDNAVFSIRTLFAQIMTLPRAVADISGADLAYIGGLLASLAVLVVVTYGGFLLLAGAADHIRRRLRVATRREGWLARALAAIAVLALDIARVLIPWAIGYGVALGALGTPGTIAYQHLLYLNAFLIVEIVLAMLRAIIAPRRADARMVTLSTVAAEAVMRWARIIGMVMVYGQLVLMPLITRNVSPAAGRVASVIGLAIVLLLLAAAILSMRAYVSRALLRLIGPRASRRTLRALARRWHVPVLIYLLGLFVIALSQPVEGFYAVIATNARIVLAIALGALVVNMISRLIGRGIALPASVNDAIPLLESRLNTVIPRALWVLRVLVVIVVLAWCLHLLGILDVPAFLETDLGIRLTGTMLTVTLVLLLGFVLWLVLNSWVDYRINPLSPHAASSRERTLLVLMRNALTIVLCVIILMFVLSEVGLNIAPLLASAGVLGLAIGFGAQRLVQDIITGIFIQLEGAIDVGDSVSIGGVTGTVERLTVRSAGLRDGEGNYHLVPFSSVGIVSNLARAYSVTVIDIPIAPEQNVEDARKAMFDAFEEVQSSAIHGEVIIGAFDWAGIDKFLPGEVVLRGSIRTMAGKQWGVRRAYFAALKRMFDQRGIAMPDAQQTIYFGRSRDRDGPPLRIVDETPRPGDPATKSAQSGHKQA